MSVSKEERLKAFDAEWEALLECQRAERDALLDRIRAIKEEP